MAFIVSAAVAAIGVTATVGAAVGIAGAGLSYMANEEAAATAESNVNAQYNYDMQNYEIQRDYSRELNDFRDEQVGFANSQLEYAYEQQAYANSQYIVAQRNNAAETAYRENAVYNQKLAAKTAFNAEADVAQLMKYGAEDAMNNAIKETLRTTGANVREVGREKTKALGTVRAKQSGITGGNSKKRELVDVFMQANRAEAQVIDKAKMSVMEASRAKDELTNNYNLKTAESYRNLQAMMQLEAQPVSDIAGPQPIFTEVAPIGPVSPIGAQPIKGAISNSTTASLAAGLSTGMTAYNFGSSVATSFGAKT